MSTIESLNIFLIGLILAHQLIHHLNSLVGMPIQLIIKITDELCSQILAEGFTFVTTESEVTALTKMELEFVVMNKMEFVTSFRSCTIQILDYLMEI